VRAWRDSTKHYFCNTVTLSVLALAQWHNSKWWRKTWSQRRHFGAFSTRLNFENKSSQFSRIWRTVARRIYLLHIEFEVPGKHAERCPIGKEGRLQRWHSNTIKSVVLKMGCVDLHNFLRGRWRQRISKSYILTLQSAQTAKLVISVLLWKNKFHCLKKTKSHSTRFLRSFPVLSGNLWKLGEVPQQNNSCLMFPQRSLTSGLGFFFWEVEFSSLLLV
jgi:hypothetical protein